VLGVGAMDQPDQWWLGGGDLAAAGLPNPTVQNPTAEQLAKLA